MPLDVNWALQVEQTINLIIFIVSLGVEAWAFVHCALQRPDAFNAVGTLSKGIWLAVIGGTVLLAMVFFSLGMQLFTLIAVTAALVYLLDVRPAIREITDGGGGW
jgi:hypothetical protein